MISWGELTAEQDCVRKWVSDFRRNIWICEIIVDLLQENVHSYLSFLLVNFLIANGHHYKIWNAHNLIEDANKTLNSRRQDISPSPGRKRKEDELSKIESESNASKGLSKIREV